jgi:long-chain fatty acid transport protein
VIGGGIHVQQTDDLSFSADIDRVLYSRLKADFIDFQAVSTGTEDQLEIRNATEVHGGLEYVLSRVRHSPALRVGLWYDPAHSVRYLTDGSNSQQDVRLKAALGEGDSLVHYTFGVGVPVSPQLEVNVGTDLSGQRRYFSASLVARFK